MSWNVEYNSELGIVEGRYIGHVTDEDFKQATVKAVNLSKANQAHLFLIDDSEWKGGTTIFGLYDLANTFEELGFDRDSRAALILPAAGTPEVEHARFFETACVNRGWKVKLFTDYQEAMGWLTNS